MIYFTYMQFLLHIAAILLSTYLAVTNLVAVQVGKLFILPPSSSSTSTTATSSHLAQLPSDYTQAGIVPDILRASQAYQQAAVIGSNDIITATTKDPLAALVNIYCTFTTPKYIRTTTGTGFFISKDGVILTNAHVAQFFLLENAVVSGKTTCTIRTGEPATPKFVAELLYIPPAWVEAHAASIDNPNPTGTGERDYALLYVTNAVDDSPLPGSFPALGIKADLLPRSVTGETVIAAGYPADSLLNNLDTDLLPKEASSTITELYTFGSNYADVFSIMGTNVGEHGSSGGPVVDNTGQVIGMITTKGDDTMDGTGSLRAITLSYINRTITEETGFSLARNVSGDLPHRAQAFTTTMAPFLSQLLAAQVNQNN